ncbi:peptidoglycan DD-metalloendopeptidase family protein [Burkholderia vietnamiensis]|uniref:Peptidase M23B n=1 Tax=Burkholderia vietnamiensis (strain G4 / LMG 22486) TaxID=269482 RepID=A4JP74_BURVG|nr:peptidoglycan DD-metalloendopeptidase family protein [Burkholderia vietnamiensis]ABO58077.1 peptidase M23B [Burkholderia vietnamiensis G4]MBR8201912.1 peptidoglycan DD-metalloendopeptidase family protein [Burkholderia vietnamiensis]MCA8226673.1 peptidoglycan DD-metalloendopeptidase family protein [Burkholderia vietnamiensis]MCA8390640.1 peptidoglycan DD-metalloendopeptidase family protein [Burkholderia vietnamiensis]MCB4343086.1 peptidoglycan DD-metalloendopeptidase family protein [Burkhold
MKLCEMYRNAAWLPGLAAVLVMAGCASTEPVPPSDTLAGPSSEQPAAALPATPVPPAAPILVVRKYVVKRGDTLSAIAAAHACSVAELRTWNKLDAHARLRRGQVLHIVRQQQPAPAQRASDATAGAVPAAPAAQTNPAAAAQPNVSPANERRVVNETRRHASAVSLTWPARGKIVDAFRPGQNRGIQIAGRPGDPVRAAADGRVMYAGTGLNDYGSLIIVQHNADFLTAYAHSRRVLVKTGDIVRQGDAIAEMGDVDSAHVALLFEVRRDGKPVNPMPYLPSSQG